MVSAVEHCRSADYTVAPPGLPGPSCAAIRQAEEVGFVDSARSGGM